MFGGIPCISAAAPAGADNCEGNRCQGGPFVYCEE
jgi:hypothetical protein